MMRVFIDGNEAIARAAIQAGCDFFAGYPITPATSILLHMTSELPKVDGIAIQGEDEIASIGLAIGAAMAGKRVMTATSGPGISLFSESIGASIMVEIPMVIVDVQRMGPATGAPTLGSFGDIQFVRWGHSGGFPIIALAPTNTSECYRLTLKSFELAERFQSPVFLLTDKEIGLTKTSVCLSDMDISVFPSKPATRKPRLGGKDLGRLTTSSHTADGYLTKDAAPIQKHNQHLLSKILDRIDEITIVVYDPQEDADSLIISYGITASAVKSAVQEHRRHGKRVSSLTIYSLWPIPEAEIRTALSNASRILIPELNHGLYRREIERLTNDHHEIVSLNRIDGGLISPDDILANL